MSLMVLKKEKSLGKAMKVTTIKTLLHKTFCHYVMNLNPVHYGIT